MSYSLPTPEDLRHLREMAGLTQKELADRAGVSQSLIARIEGGDVDPRLSTLRRILSAIASVQEGRVATDIMHSPVIYVKATDTVREAVELMEKHAISQMPVMKGGKVVGSIQEATLIKKILRSDDPRKVFEEKVEDVMEEPFLIVSPSTTMVEILSLFSKERPAILVMDRGKVVGIITKIDVITAAGRKRQSFALYSKGKEKKSSFASFS